MISDEYGIPVLVTAKSPANTYVNKLKRRGFDWIVLPRRVFLGLTTPEECGTMVDTSTEQRPPRAIPTGAANVGTLGQWALLRIRLADCLEVLSED